MEESGVSEKDKKAAELIFFIGIAALIILAAAAFLN